MHAFLSSFLGIFTAIFVVVDPLPVAPMFAAMAVGRSPEEIRRIALRASVAGASLLLFFTFFGGLVFRALSLELSALRVAGGLLLLLTALDMLRARVSETRSSAREVEATIAREDISIVPLATPLLAGPGAIATVMVLAAARPGLMGRLPVVIAIVVSFVIAYFTLRGARALARVLGVSGTAMLERVMGLLLAAIGVQFIAEGARELMNRG